MPYVPAVFGEYTVPPPNPFPLTVCVETANGPSAAMLAAVGSGPFTCAFATAASAKRPSPSTHFLLIVIVKPPDIDAVCPQSSPRVAAPFFVCLSHPARTSLGPHRRDKRRLYTTGRRGDGHGLRRLHLCASLHTSVKPQCGRGALPHARSGKNRNLTGFSRVL